MIMGFDRTNFNAFHKSRVFCPLKSLKEAQNVLTSGIFNRFETKEGNIWLVACVKNSADYIYFWNKNNQNGFYGRTLTFRIAPDGKETLSLTGPWHSGSEAFYRATGIDIRDKHKTSGIVALDRIALRTLGCFFFSRVLYDDMDVPVIGLSDRIERIAQTYLNNFEFDHVYYAYQTVGEGRSGAKFKHVE